MLGLRWRCGVVNTLCSQLGCEWTRSSVPHPVEADLGRVRTSAVDVILLLECVWCSLARLCVVFSTWTVWCSLARLCSLNSPGLPHDVHHTSCWRTMVGLSRW